MLKNIANCYCFALITACDFLKRLNGIHKRRLILVVGEFKKSKAVIYLNILELRLYYFIGTVGSPFLSEFSRVPYRTVPYRTLSYRPIPYRTVPYPMVSYRNRPSIVLKYTANSTKNAIFY
jgi:hypothetical protein